MMQLHSYFRSSASYRVRIALNWKGQPYATVPVHLLNDGGQQHAPAFAALNPEQLVPVLSDGGQVFTQSLAILEYLEERFPQPPLLPHDIVLRAQARSIALAIACDVHPLNNLRVLRYLKRSLQVSDEDRDRWYRHWIAIGFDALESRLTSVASGAFCIGDGPTFADLCLVPQVFNARRFAVDMTRYPRIAEIDRHCLGIDAFAAAAPERQPDAA
ncbi:MAG: maleylacetoacetate isomerase [Herbaspirillum sp.]|jgi:maleylpyruvate isomerase|nr:maleylacetoacetate isomerase [Herbaspirillum sp.]